MGVPTEKTEKALEMALDWIEVARTQAGPGRTRRVLTIIMGDLLELLDHEEER